MLSTRDLQPSQQEELVLALLPPYRRLAARHWALEALLELGAPLLVLAMGIFFSVSAIALMFQ